MLDYSVRLNSLLVPIGAVDTTLVHCTRSLIAVNDDDIFPISLVGSCISVRYRERYLVLCTRHQLKGWDLQRIALLTDDGKHTISSGGVRHFNEANETDFHDLTAFDFTEPCLEIESLRERFFLLKEFPPDVPSDQIVGFVAAGYPFEKQNYDLENGRRLGRAALIVTCVLDGSNQPNDPALMRLRSTEPLTFNPNGMSGGPAFVVQMTNGEPHAFFAGIITRAGPEHIYIVGAGFVRQFMDTWLDHLEGCN